MAPCATAEEGLPLVTPVTVDERMAAKIASTTSVPIQASVLYGPRDIRLVSIIFLIFNLVLCCEKI